MAIYGQVFREVLAAAAVGRWDNAVLAVFDSVGNRLVEFTLASPAFTLGGSGSATASGLPISGSVTTTGTASYGTLTTSGGTEDVDSITVGTSNAEAILSDLSLEAGQIVNLTQFNYTQPGS